MNIDNLGEIYEIVLSCNCILLHVFLNILKSWLNSVSLWDIQVMVELLSGANSKVLLLDFSAEALLGNITFWILDSIQLYAGA